METLRHLKVSILKGALYTRTSNEIRWFKRNDFSLFQVQDGDKVITNDTLNIYSEIGIIILIGISTKNGILIVEFANQLRDQGLVFRDALLQSCEVRLRPVLMTALSTMMGSIPLILATGAGSESRITLGVVIFSGVFVATLMTLFVIPVFYDLLARNTGSPAAVAQKLDQLEQEAGLSSS